MPPILEVSGISKKYRLRHLSGGYLSLRENLTNFFRREESIEDFWALKDVSFQLDAGDSVGIVGRNGAGKSTLLKILSKITPPTRGKIHLRGRVASLLEVGTGFHPELTGRENIAFNGSLLGMKRREIQAKFDEIVDFSGTETFLDTPLKHYSSGMQLRLAFSVAAFLEPEILVIDEVLAVGDAEFQKKCLGKMEEVSTQQGRTILFVSHHMAAMKKLCKKAILLSGGTIASMGDSETIAQQYLQAGMENSTEKIWAADGSKRRNEKITPLRAAVYPGGKSPGTPIKTSDDVVIEIDFLNLLPGRNIDVTFDIFDSGGVHLTHFGMICSPTGKLPGGQFRTQGIVPGNILNTNQYMISVQFGLDQSEVLMKESEILCFDVVDDIKTRGRNFSRLPGIIHPICRWTTHELN
jgi:lipopolysaccharide transport system ATP-binding protein